ncbi:MAG: glucose-phosphate adenylyltransferase [Chloroflexota bacterium]|nr:glucose-phosphate adenylyltransferase [Chloroflexota bacterium]
MRSVVSLILAGGQGERLSVLSRERAKPAVPFGGKYRIIDFTLSNCVNSGLYDVAVLTQYRPHSLNDHIGIGRPWDLDRTHRGVRLLQPFLGRHDSDWYRGTADAVYQNLGFISSKPDDQILILSGDHVYRMDYRRMVDFHERMGADATVAVFEVPIEEANRFGTLITDDEDRVIAFEEKPANPRSSLISMGVYVFDRAVLQERLTEDAGARSTHDFGHDIIPSMVGRDNVYAYRFHGYWRDVGTVESYWDANMELLEDPPPFDLYDPDWVIHTRSEERPPARILNDAQLHRSLVSHGCTIQGTVEHSVLSPGVCVGPGAIVRDSILMTDTVIEAGAIVDRSILDKEVRVGAGAVVGFGEANVANRVEPQRLNAGFTLVGKRAVIPGKMRIGRNCMIDAGAQEADYSGPVVASGESIITHAPDPATAPMIRRAASV